MKINAAISIVEGNIEAIDQGIELVEAISDDQYCFVALPYVKSTIGQHFRHVLDMFRSVISPSDVIDYDARRRGADIETRREVAIEELYEIRHWMIECIKEMPSQIAFLQEDLSVVCEVMMSETHRAETRSNRLRELVFTSSHAVHHYALISVIAKVQGVTLDESLGVAPATASYLRAESGNADDSHVCAP